MLRRTRYAAPTIAKGDRRITLVAARIASPIGELTLIASDDGLVAVLWPDDDAARVPLGATHDDPGHPVLRQAATELDAYFAGSRTRFTIPLDMRGTDFQQAVWRALIAIPFGATTSYGAIARSIGRPDAVRAVGAANGRNPLSIVAPCHRVVGAGGSLTGFAGGLAAKAWLLDHESGQRALFG